jgi:hypothetical protein
MDVLEAEDVFPDKPIEILAPPTAGVGIFFGQKRFGKAAPDKVMIQRASFPRASRLGRRDWIKPMMEVAASSLALPVTRKD